ncbi:tetratricopeptide repeat protein [Erythrobacter aureus]|uniref:YaiO family outer membrane beta-barrel protein n=1 Tax=Erythrobacter aureus TaxID=2182384 RepID=A0A345YGT7_9SPHN|nr:tetratricopeptide repeat protein [Erythrobacter aureus]AXK43139.1 YaiO family outer membrane beta-barrel protein [Erythrobacter aureus]
MKRAFSTIALLLNLLAAPLEAQESEIERGLPLEQAAEARAKGDFERARQILVPLIAESPKNVDLLRQLAMVEAGAGDLDAALTRVEEARRLAPDDLDVALARAFILTWRGDIREARRAAALISARNPEYPELDQLNAILMRQDDASGFRPKALSIGAGLSGITTAGGTRRTWNSQTLVGAFDVSSKSTITLGAMREDRGAIDTRLSARIDQRIENGSIYLAATTVPRPDFQEHWSVGTGGELTIAEGVSALIDARVSDYDTGTIVLAQPGLRAALDDNFSVTGRVIKIIGGRDDFRIGGSVRLDYRSASDLSVFAIVASYPDAEADGVRQLRSVAVGVRIPMSEVIFLTAAGSYENRDASYERSSANLTLTYRFGAR